MNDPAQKCAARVQKMCAARFFGRLIVDSERKTKICVFFVSQMENGHGCVKISYGQNQI